MHPIVFGLPAFLVVLPVGVAAGCWPAIREMRRRGLAPSRLLPFLSLALVVGLLGGKLYSIADRGEVGPLSWEMGTGFRYPGAIVALVLALPLLRRALPSGISAPAALDMVGPGAGIAMGVMRIHCLLSGCCAGAVCSYPWCVSFPRASPPFQHQMIDGLILPSAAQSLPIHPLQIYFMLASFAAAAFAMWFQQRASYAGQTFLVFLAAHEGAKVLLEILRYPSAPLVQLGSLVLGLGALVLLIALDRRHRGRQRASGDFAG